MRTRMAGQNDEAAKGGISGTMTPSAGGLESRFGCLRRPLERDELAWLDCIRAAAVAGEKALMPLVGTAAGRTVLGRGVGGDQTIELDQVTETAMLDVFAARAPYPYLLVSEETGYAGRADARWRLVVDPVDGSLNAKRGLEPFAAAIAVSVGITMADLLLGYVRDYTRGYEYVAFRGAGPILPREPITAVPDGAVEIVLIEAGRPDRHKFCYGDLVDLDPSGTGGTLRIRQVGSLALGICLVASSVADVLVAPVPSRAVDIAAGLLVLVEAGGGAASLDGTDLWGQPLDLERRAAFVAWRPGLDGGEIASRSRKLFAPRLGC